LGSPGVAEACEESAFGATVAVRGGEVAQLNVLTTGSRSANRRNPYP